MYKHGIPVKVISKKLGIGNTTLFRCLKRNNIEKRGQPEIRVARIIKSCPVCGSKIEVTPSAGKTRFKYCSQECYWKSLHGRKVFDRTGLAPANKNQKIERLCPNCGKKMFLHPYRVKGVVQNYCSARCAISDKWKDMNYKNHMSDAHIGQNAWNKGKTLEELHGPEKAQKLLKFNSDKMIALLKSGKLHKSTNTKIEVIIKEELIKAGFREGVDFFQQYKIDRYVCDFAFPQERLIIECQGDYWHVNPQKYCYDSRNPKTYWINGIEKKLASSQIKAIKKDEKRFNNLLKNGWECYEIWESDIHHLHNRKCHIEAIKRILERKRKELAQ